MKKRIDSSEHALKCVSLNSFEDFEKPNAAMGSRDAMPDTPLTPRSSQAATKKAPEKPSFKHLFVSWERQDLSIFIPATLSCLGVAGAKAAYAFILGSIFDVLVKFGTLTVSADDTRTQIYRWCLALTGLGIAKAFGAFALVCLWIVCGERRARSVRSRLYSSLLRKNMAWFDGQKDGMAGMMTGIQTHTRELQLATSQLQGHIVCDGILSFICVVAAFTQCWELTLLILGTVPISVLVLRLLGKRLKPATEAQRLALGQASKHATASLFAIDIVKVYNGHDEDLWQYLQSVKIATRHYLTQALCACSQMGYVKFWMISLFVTGFWFGVFLVDHGRTTAGKCLATFYLVLIAFQAVESLGTQWLTVVKGMTAGQSLERLTMDSKEGCQAAQGAKLRILGRPPEDIELVNVSFSYPSNPTKMVLKPSSFFFPSREISFIVGRSGSGKSTIADLIVQFYKPRSGQVLINSTPVDSLDSNWLRNNITLVQQSSTLFRGTFAMNVSLGHQHPQQVTRDQIKASCETAVLQSTLNNLPDGLDTIVGPSGHALSGGQKQRLALARAKLRDPSILVLDEITSGLDPLTGDMIMEAIRTWRRGKTTIIITHDVSQIESDDYVYVMDTGSIVQEGYCKSIAQEEGGQLHSMLQTTQRRNDSVCSLSSPGALSIGSDWEVSDIEKKSAMESLFFPSANGQTPSQGFFKRMTMLAPAVYHHPASLGQAEARRYNMAHENRSSLELIQEIGEHVQVKRRHDSHIRRTMSNGDSGDLAEGLSQKQGTKRETQKTEKRVASLRSIWRTVWPALDISFKIQLVGGLVASCVVAAANPGFSYLFAEMLQAFWAPGNKESVGRRPALLLLGLAFLDGLSVFASFYLMERVAQQWVDTLRAEAFKRSLRQPKAWFDKPKHAPNRIAECLDRNAEEMKKLVSVFVPILVIAAGMVLASITWALSISWKLTLVTLSAGPLVVAATQWASAVSDKCEARCNRAAEATGSILNEVVSNIRVVRAFTLEEHFTEEFERSAQETFKLGVSRAWKTGSLYGLNQGMSDWLTALVFFYSVHLLTTGEGQIGMDAIIKVANLLLFSIGTAAVMLGNIPQIAASKAVATQLLYYANLSLHSSHEHKGGLRAPHPFPIKMNGAQFKYPSRPDTMVLRNMNLEINQADFIAVIGPSGGGKSTVVSLLLRLYEPVDPEGTTTSITNLYNPTTGRRRLAPLTYANIPAHTLDTTALRQKLAYVSQHPFLFPTSISHNITYGLHDDSPLRHHPNVEAAARAAGLHDFIISLPQGYQTPVGDGGLALSGGQAQRLGIARALVRRPQLLVMDEPTSALDAEAAEGLRRTLLRIMSAREMAVVVVTHSREMMAVADRVVVVDGGVVATEGRYQELLRTDRRFVELVGEGG